VAEVMGFFDVFSFVKTTVTLIESDLSVTVSKEAQDELVNRMRPHEREVSEDLASGKMSLNELRAILFSIIEKAASFDPEGLIDKAAISDAMDTECHYLGWC
jgi:hypothetical protein